MGEGDELGRGECNFRNGGEGRSRLGKEGKEVITPPMCVSRARIFLARGRARAEALRQVCACHGIGKTARSP